MKKEKANNKIDKRMKLYYPYCGYKEGFCLSREGCIEPGEFDCPLFSKRHPVTKLPPQSLMVEV